MAAGIFRALLPRAWADRVEVLSAGTSAARGEEATELARRTAAESGIDIGGHRSRPLTRELLFGADLILVMTARHREWVREEAPEAADKVVLLRDLVTSSDPAAGKDIPDPIGRPASAYREAFDAIREALRAGWPEIERRLSESEGSGAEKD
jgi:protein-tyrosine-phosphatase